MAKVNWINFSVLVVYPILLLIGAIIYGFKYGISSFEIIMLVGAYYCANISVGVGLHRLWSHHSYKVNKVVEFFLVFLSAGTLQGPVIAWASDHYYHHIHTDKEHDPHSPFKYKNKLKGFFWSHIGWLLYQEKIKINPSVYKKFSKNKLVLWQYRYYWQVAVFMNLIVPLTIGYMASGSIKGAIAAYLFMGVGRALQQQMTFCVNSVCHLIGKRNYVKGTASDIWWLGLFLLGENWHNFHHAFPSDYRNGVKWYHFDVHKWIIFLLSKLGLAWDLNKTSNIRIYSKANDTLKYYLESEKQEWDNILAKVQFLKGFISGKLSELNNSSDVIKNSFLLKCEKFNELLENISQQASKFASISEKSSKRIIQQVHKEINKIERSVNLLLNSHVMKS